MFPERRAVRPQFGGCSVGYLASSCPFQECIQPFLKNHICIQTRFFDFQNALSYLDSAMLMQIKGFCPVSSLKSAPAERGDAMVSGSWRLARPIHSAPKHFLNRILPGLPVPSRAATYMQSVEQSSCYHGVPATTWKMTGH